MKWIAKALSAGFLLFALSAGELLAAQLTIPAGRLPGGVLWSSNSVGVVGGIPNVTTIYASLWPSNGSAAIYSALQRCPSNEVVYLNPGVYLITNNLIWGNNYAPNVGSGVVLRGAGMGQTILEFTNNTYIWIYSIGGINNNAPSNSAVQWLNGYSQGSTNIVISCATNGLTHEKPLSVGDMLFLTEEIDTNLVNPVGNEGSYSLAACLYDTWGNYCYEQQAVMVTGISSGTNLTIWPGVYMTNIQSSLRPQAFWSSDSGTGIPEVPEMEGIENLTVDDRGDSDDGITAIQFFWAYNCWVRNVEIANPWYAGVAVWKSAHCEVDGCYIHDSHSGGASTSYGVNLSGSSDAIVQNNIFYRITAPLLPQQSAGCVMAYNFCTNMLYGVSPGAMMASLAPHGAHNDMDLFEGNVGTEEEDDYVHGSSSHTMSFRNYLSGNEGNLNNVTNFHLLYTTAATIQATNRYMSYIGNVLGTDGISTNYESSPVASPGDNNVNFTIWNIGWFDGNDTLTPDVQTVTTLWRDGNYDYATHSTIWDGSGAVTLPASLYLTAKPAWWSNSVPFPPIGGDLTPLVSQIPAQLRFEAMMGVNLTLGEASLSPPTGLNVLTTNGP